MSGEQFLTVLLVGLVVLLVRYYWNLREFPQIACSKCHGAGWRMKWIFHLSSLRRRKVRGPCHRCEGSPWTNRRGS